VPWEGGAAAKARAKDHGLYAEIVKIESELEVRCRRRRGVIHLPPPTSTNRSLSLSIPSHRPPLPVGRVHCTLSACVPPGALVREA
jgi:hypothetical protein